MSRAGLTTLLVLILAGSASAKPRLQLSAELGPEIDTNPARVTGEDELDGDLVIYGSYDGAAQIVAPLLRLVGTAALTLDLGRHRLYGAYGGGGKLYWSEVGQVANEIVQHATLAWTIRGKAAAVRFDGFYYDAFLRQLVQGPDCNQPNRPCPPQRDFRTGRAGGSILIGRKATTARVGVGYTGLEFKPSPDFSYHGLVLGGALRWALTQGRGDATADWALSASYRATLRFFAGAAVIPGLCTDGSYDCPTPGSAARRDFNHNARIELDYLGRAAGQLSYSIEINRSNSLGESYVRHAIGLQFTAPLPLSVFFTASLVLQLSSFDDLLFSRVSTLSFVDIDSENRSRLLLHFARDIAKNWAVMVRYSLYVNESGATSSGEELPSFLRQTVFLGVRFEYDSDE